MATRGEGWHSFVLIAGVGKGPGRSQAAERFCSETSRVYLVGRAVSESQGEFESR